MKRNLDLGASLFFLVGGFVFLVFVQGYVVSLLWLWFLVPLGVPAITHLVGAGIVLLVRVIMFLTKDIMESGKDNDITWEYVLSRLVVSYLFYAVVLVTAYVITLFM